MTISHEAAVEGVRSTYSVTMATLEEDHAATVQGVKTVLAGGDIEHM